MAGTSLQVAQPALGTVSRKPQSTAAGEGGPGAPFNRSARQGQVQGPLLAGQAFGFLWTPILKPVPGWLREFTLYVSASGGAGGTTAAVGAADAPWNVISNCYVKDPFGQLIIQADGYSLFLINIYGGQSGMLGFGNAPAALPSFSAIASSGNFTIRLRLPLEFDTDGYCSLSNMNAASQPQITVNGAAAATVYSTQPSPTLPTIQTQIDEPFWTAPIDHPELAPADPGSSAQWSVAKTATGVAASAFQRLLLPRVGSFIHTLIMVLRDSTNARIEAFPSTDIQFWVDGVPLLIESLNERQDLMYERHGVARPTGVVAYTFRNSALPFASNADTHDMILPTTPGTLLEFVGTFGAITNAPAQLFAITGELFPVGGLPYTHLAD